MRRLKEGGNSLWAYSGYDPQHVLYYKYPHHSIHKHRCPKRMGRTNIRGLKTINLKGNLKRDTEK